MAGNVDAHPTRGRQHLWSGHPARLTGQPTNALHKPPRAVSTSTQGRNGPHQPTTSAIIGPECSRRQPGLVGERGAFNPARGHDIDVATAFQATPRSLVGRPRRPNLAIMGRTAPSSPLAERLPLAARLLGHHRLRRTVTHGGRGPAVPAAGRGAILAPSTVLTVGGAGVADLRHLLHQVVHLHPG